MYILHIQIGLWVFKTKVAIKIFLRNQSKPFFLKKKIGTKVDPTGKQMYLIFPTILFDAYLVQAVNPNIARTQKLDRLLVFAFESKKR